VDLSPSSQCLTATLALARGRAVQAPVQASLVQAPPVQASARARQVQASARALPFARMKNVQRRL
jgi:hypothetical protein